MDTALQPIHPAARIGSVSLTVRDLERSIAFYTERLGFRLHGRKSGEARLGAGGDDLLVLAENPLARPARGRTGLYHFAVLLPSRHDLARALAQLERTGTVLQGASDHGVSEALYLADPDQNGIEIYRDRPREEWPFANGRLAMVTEPLDLDDVLSEQTGEVPPGGLAAGTTIGHVHLHVADLAAAKRFYADVLGFGVMQGLGNSALFVSAGGYHHHIGLNTWQGVGAPPPPASSTGLRHFTLRLPDRDTVEEVVDRLRAAGIAVDERDGGGRVEDPSGNAILLAAVNAGG